MEGADGGGGWRGLRERPDGRDKRVDQGTKRRTRGRSTPKTKLVQYHHIQIHIMESFASTHLGSSSDSSVLKC